MRLPSVPGPFDVVHAVTDLRDGVADALALVPRLGAALGRMEGYLDRVGGLLDRVDAVVDRAEEAIDAVSATQAKADAAIEGVDRTQSKADDAVARVEGLLGRVEPLLGDYAPALAALAPSVRRLAATLEPDEVEAMVTLIDRLPQLVTHLDEDILPVLGSLDNVGEDVHDLVDTLQ